jgi:PAS domain S-box-containing protein
LIIGIATKVVMLDSWELLQGTESKYRNLLEKIPAIVYVASFEEGSPVYVNPQIETALGYPQEEWLSGPDFWSGLIHAEDRKRVERISADMRATGAPFLAEYRMRSKDGRWLWFRDESVLGYDDDGQPSYVQGVMYDITARKLAEEALWSVENRLHNVINSIPVVIIALDAHGVVTLSEGNGLERIGVKPGEMVGRSGYEYFGSIQITLEMGEGISGDAVIQRVLAGETIVGLSEFGGMYFKNQCTPMRDSDQQVVGAIIVAYDITARVLAGHALKQSEARYHNLFEYSPVSLWEEDFSAIKSHLEELKGLGVADFKAFFEANPAELIDCVLQARVIDVNRATLAMYKAQGKAELLGDLGRISDEKTLPAHKESILAIAAGKAEFEVVTVNRTLDGEPIDIQLRWSVAPGCEGTYEKVLVSISDITERRRIERAEREHRALAEALRDTASVLNSTLNREEVLDHILGNIGRVIDFDTAEILMIEDGVARISRYRGYEKMGMAPGDAQSMCFRLGDFPSLHKMLEGNRVLIIPDTDRDGSWVAVPRLRWIKSFAGAPIRVREQVIGFLNIASATPGFFGEEHGPRLQSLADQAGIALGNAQLYDQMLTGRERMRQLTQQVVSAQEQERRRLSRELHDEAGQSLTALKIGLQLVLADLPQELETQRQQMQEAVALTEQTMGRMHRLAHDLRPPALDAIGLIPTLRDLCQNVGQRSGLAVSFTDKDVPDLPDTINVCLYRFLQEALTNALKHAKAERIWVRIWSNATEVSLLIRDDGKGFDPTETLLFSGKGGGMGLLGMHERLELVGGKLEIQTSPGHGASLTARVPIDQAYIERRQSDDSRGGRR